MVTPVNSLLNTPLHGVQLVNAGIASSELAFEYTPYTIGFSAKHTDSLTPNESPVWTLHDQGERYSSLIELYEVNQDYLLSIKCEGTGTFQINSQSIRVNWQQQGTHYNHYLQSIGLATWLEQQNVPCIHANAITYNNQAYLVIAPSRTGKSTLTTFLTTQGFKLMTDDMAAIHANDYQDYVIYPSWPKVRLWPDVTEQLLGTELENPTSKQQKNHHENISQALPLKGASLDGQDLEDVQQHTKAPLKCAKVHQRFAKNEIDLQQSKQSKWHHSPAKLKGIYYLERLDSAAKPVEITSLSAKQSLVMLLQNSMLANAYTSMGLEQSRLKQLAELITSVPLFKLQYQSGLQHLNKVSDSLKRHINDLP